MSTTGWAIAHLRDLGYTVSSPDEIAARRPGLDTACEAAERIHVTRFAVRNGETDAPDSFYAGVLHARMLACPNHTPDHMPEAAKARHPLCTDDCTTDCGVCKGNPPPPEPRPVEMPAGMVHPDTRTPVPCPARPAPCPGHRVGAFTYTHTFTR